MQKGRCNGIDAAAHDKNGLKGGSALPGLGPKENETIISIFLLCTCNVHHSTFDEIYIFSF